MTNDYDNSPLRVADIEELDEYAIYIAFLNHRETVSEILHMMADLTKASEMSFFSSVDSRVLQIMLSASLKVRLRRVIKEAQTHTRIKREEDLKKWQTEGGTLKP